MPRPDSTDFNSTVAWFRERLPLTDSEFADLRTRATAKANELARQALDDAQADVQDALARAVRKGMNLDTFKDTFSQQFAKAWGVDGETAGHRLDGVFRQNVQNIYSSARREQMLDPAVLKVRPFWQFIATLDGGTTDVCRKLGSPPTILPAEHAFWSTHQPPLHFGCRSAIKALTKATAERRGVSPRAPRAKPDEGFGEGEDL